MRNYGVCTGRKPAYRLNPQTPVARPLGISWREPAHSAGLPRLRAHNRPDDFAHVTGTALAGGLHGTYDAVSDVATLDELLNHAAGQGAVELPPAISLDCAELELEPEMFSSWYVSRRVSGERLASRGITPTRRWRQMLDSVWAPSHRSPARPSVTPGD